MQDVLFFQSAFPQKILLDIFYFIEIYIWTYTCICLYTRNNGIFLLLSSIPRYTIPRYTIDSYIPMLTDILIISSLGAITIKVTMNICV